MSRYDHRNECRGGRCAWCWEALGTTESHTVIRALSAPEIELRFHNRCWPVYRSLSGIEGKHLKALYREWNPARVEALRLHAGLNMHQFVARLGVCWDHLSAYLAGQRPRLGQKALAGLRSLAVDTHFESQEETGTIDWSDRRAVFSLCMQSGWTAGELARRLGVMVTTVTAWWDRGCSQQSVRHWARLTTVAREQHFDAGMLLDDHLWTPALAREALERSGLSRAAFAQAVGYSSDNLGVTMRGERAVNRQVAFALTRAAIQLGLPLPPTGRFEPFHRKPRPFPGGHKGPQGDRVWTPAELALLGTMPDKEVAARLPNRSRIAVMQMRRKLRIPKVPWRGWDGSARPAPVPLAEVLAKYYRRLGMEPPPV